MSAAVPRIAVFSTGGTIASKRSDGGAASPNLTADDLVAAVPQLADVANIEAVSFRQVASSELTVSDVIDLAERISGAVAGGATGTVITQGTNTIEETSFVLDLLWDREEPIVVTGAMRHPGLPGADGPANLLASAVVAASPLARDLGCVVVFNDEVHLPLFIRKTHTSNPATFRSPLTGPIGWIEESRLCIALRPSMRHHITIQGVPAVVPPVGLVKVVLGDDGRVLTALGSLGYEGLVVEATGGGHVPRAMVEPLAALAKHMPVVLYHEPAPGRCFAAPTGSRVQKPIS